MDVALEICSFSRSCSFLRCLVSYAMLCYTILLSVLAKLGAITRWW